jgi:hypothetical protein
MSGPLSAAGAVLRGLRRARASAGLAVAETVVIVGAMLGAQARWHTAALSER